MRKWIVAAGVTLAGLAVWSIYQYFTYPVRTGEYILLTSDQYRWPEEHIFAMLPDGSGLRRLVKGFEPSCSPDGRRIAFVAPVGPPQPDGRDPYTQIFLMDADGASMTQLTFDDRYHGSPVWPPDSQRLAFRVDDGLLTWSSDGLHQVRSNSSITIMDLNSRSVTYLGNHNWTFEDAAWSPYGTQLLVSAHNTGTDENDGLYLMNIDGSDITRLTSSKDRRPAWSPDGQYVVFLRQENVDTVENLIVMGADGSNLVNLLPETQVLSAPKWSPDSQRIIFVGYHVLSFKESGSVTEEWRNAVYSVSRDGTGQRLIIEPRGQVWGTDSGGFLPLLRTVSYGDVDWCKVR